MNKKNKTILCVEDNMAVQEFNKSLLEVKGFTVVSAMTIADAKKAIEREIPNLIILDINMPDGNGLNFLRELRKTSQVPVLVLTGDSTDNDLVSGFASGCDDYVPKPYTFPVLYARIEGLLRRASSVPETIVKGRLSLDVTADIATLDGINLMLTQKEFALLLIFIQNEGNFYDAEYLYEKIWKAPFINDDSAIKSAVSRLRKKLSGSGYMISSERREGYILERE